MIISTHLFSTSSLTHSLTRSLARFFAHLSFSFVFNHLRPHLYESRKSADDHAVVQLAHEVVGGDVLRVCNANTPR